MLTTIIALALASLHASPAKAGAQERSGRDWAPAFAGEALLLDAGKGTSSVNPAPTPSGGMSPIDAERAFAADAKTIGQWTAFRKWSTDDAVMFVPQPVNAHAWLKDRTNPPKAIDWWPTASWISCDGKLAVNTGGWKRPDGSFGYFSTVWIKQPNGGWKWILDHGNGNSVSRARPMNNGPAIRRASCHPIPRTAARAVVGIDDQQDGAGAAPDETLRWYWIVKPEGERRLNVSLWDGRQWDDVVDDWVSPATLAK